MSNLQPKLIVVSISIIFRSQTRAQHLHLNASAWSHQKMASPSLPKHYMKPILNETFTVIFSPFLYFSFCCVCTLTYIWPISLCNKQQCDSIKSYAISFWMESSKMSSRARPFCNHLLRIAHSQAIHSKDIDDESRAGVHLFLLTN